MAYSPKDSKFGLFIKSFIITAQDGSLYRLSAKPREKWQEAIMQAREELIRGYQRELQEA